VYGGGRAGNAGHRVIVHAGDRPGWLAGWLAVTQRTRRDDGSRR